MITGTLINYYFHCKTQCWHHANHINLEDNSEDVRIKYFIRSISQRDQRMPLFLYDVGLGYLSPGRDARTSSGVEVQRIKLAKELSKSDTGNTLYILDEPEAALSPARQMSIITLIHELVKQGSQFIISTHSPILLAYPSSTIYETGENRLEEKNYDDTQTVAVTR